MAQWYVKELSKLTQVSVQTLHHYDRIALLQPSVRLPNGYRLYSEKDLLKLQQIVALKFFGFELSQVKELLSGDINILEHFNIQSKFLADKGQTLLNASNTLASITKECNNNNSIPWQRIIEIIGVYRMTEQVENNWLAKFLSADELKEYANFEKELKTKYTLEDKEIFEKDWASLVADINQNIDADPASQSSIAIAERCMESLNKLYFNKYHKLRKSIWEKGFKTGSYEQNKHGLSSEAIAWLDKAVTAYYTQRIRAILIQVGTTPDSEVKVLWDQFLFEKCGEDKASQREFMQYIIDNKYGTDKTRDWLGRNYL